MNSDESFPTDASTVHRTDEQGPRELSTQAPANSPLNSHGASFDASDLENAKTVIRDGSKRGGSSRAQRASDINGLGRTPAAITQVLQGKQLNHFLLQELIGGGGMGAVFRAHDEQLDREVAIKVIPFAGEDADLQRRFRNEAQSAAKLDHPRIARVFDVGNQDDWYYIVFEYIKGTNIRDLVQRGDVLAIDDAVYYTCQVAEALQHASDRGIVHRDVKPSNVLIDSDREVKLVDMGLARSDKMEMSQEDLTASGVTLGTFDYISPEQAKDPRAADLRSDIYSLGCTLYFMLTGQPPYPGGTMLQKLLSHGNAPPPDARHYRNGVSHELSAIIQKMLAKEPDQRYQNANDLIMDLREVASREGLMRSQGVSAVSIGVTNPIVTWLEQNASWLVAGTLLLLGAGWLQLSSAVSRDEFQLTPPATATLASAEPANAAAASQTQPATTQSTDRNDSSALAAGIESDAIDENRLEDAVNTSTSATSLRRPSDPPSLKNLPVPEEIGSATSMASSADNLYGSGPLTSSADSAFAGVSPQGVEPTLTEFPRLVRVVSSEATFDAIGNPIQRDVDGAALTTSLSEALELSERYDVDRIELAAATIFSEPITIRRDGLTIASTVGGSAIVFQTPPSLGIDQSDMIQLGSNKIEFDDIHFVWDVETSQIANGSLISLNANRLIRLTDCSITIGNAAGSSEVCAFSVATNPVAQVNDVPLTDDFGDTPERVLPLVAIQMYNVIVRGQISLIKLDCAAALQLQWENGLLAISQRMIDTAGALKKPSLVSSPIQLSFRQLTSHTPEGVLKMNLRDAGRYPVAIDRDVSNCIFVVDADVPHFEIVGLDSLENEPAILESRGRANAYEFDRMMLRLEDRIGNKEYFSMEDLATSSPTWWDERSTLWTIRWKEDPNYDIANQAPKPQSLADIPPDQRTPSDYRQDGAVFGGFDEKSLPRLPFESDRIGLDDSVEDQPFSVNP